MVRSIRVAAAGVYRCILIECISELCISDRVDLKLVAGLSSIRVAFLHCGVSSIRGAAAGAALDLINPTPAPESRSSSSEIN